MAERSYIPHTYTYDQFTTFFYDGRVYFSDTSYPIGQCCVDIANMDEEVLERDRPPCGGVHPCGAGAAHGKRQTALRPSHRRS